MNKKHYNAKHIEVIRVDGNVVMVVAGRGVGKSTSIIAPRAARCVFDMPQSLGLFVASSFTQLKTKTLPPVIEGWRQMNYKRYDPKTGLGDYVIGKRGPAHWPEPYFMPEDLTNFIHWRNGTGILMVSMKNSGSANGISCDWIIGDEVKFWDRVRFAEEILPTLRGSTSGPARALWSKKGLYKSLLMCTDMPTGRKSDWIFEYEKLMDRDQVRLIKHLYDEQQKLLMAQLESDSDSYKSKLQDKINSLQVELDHWRKDCVHYVEASALDNIEILGKSYLKRMKQELSPLVYQTSVLNWRLKRSEFGFYPDLDPDIHAKEHVNEAFIQTLGYDDLELLRRSTDSRSDDLDPSAPLEVALDNGGNFNCIVTGQKRQYEIRINSGHHVHNPKLVRDLINVWCKYYKHHQTKVVYYYYDHTAYPKHGTTTETYKSQAIDTWEANGWRVVPIYIGETASYEVRHALSSDLFKGQRADLPDYTYNQPKCIDLEISMMNAEAKEGTNGMEKNKKSEHINSDVPAEHATHYSDAHDTLIVGMLKKRTVYSSGSMAGGVV